LKKLSAKNLILNVERQILLQISNSVYWSEFMFPFSRLCATLVMFVSLLSFTHSHYMLRTSKIHMANTKINNISYCLKKSFHVQIKCMYPIFCLILSLFPCVGCLFILHPTLPVASCEWSPAVIGVGCRAQEPIKETRTWVASSDSRSVGRLRKISRTDTLNLGTECLKIWTLHVRHRLWSLLVTEFL
jgi:hypothetical protein